MNKRKWIPVWSLLAAVAVLITAVACGGDDDDDEVAGVAQEPRATATATATATPDPKAGWPTTFKLGFFGGDDAEETLRRQKPIQDYLAEKLGVKVEVQTGTSYSAVIEAMRADRVDAMLVGPFAYVLAVQEADAEALAVYVSTRAEPPVYSASILPAYHSVIFTKKGSGIRTVEDLRGKDFNFVDPASTSGHLAPKTLLIKLGINPDKDMKTVFAGTHPTSVLSVWNGKAPAGATHEGNLVNLAKEGQIKWCAYPDGKFNIPRTEAEIRALYDSCPDGSIVVVAQSDPIPSTPFAIRTEMPESFKQAVKDALLEIKDDPELIAQTRSWYVDPHEEQGFASLDQYYNSLRDIAKLLNLNLKELE